MRLTTAVSPLVLALAFHGAARAAEPEHRGLSLLLNAGDYSGFGAGLAFGTGDLGVRGFGGWAPILIVVEEAGSSNLKFYSSLLAGGDVYFRLFKPQPSSDVGVQAGYRYSSALGHGLAFGGYGQFALSRSVEINVSLGVLVYPDGEDRLRTEENIPSSTTFSFPGPKANLAAGVSLAFFP